MPFCVTCTNETSAISPVCLHELGWFLALTGWQCPVCRGNDLYKKIEELRDEVGGHTRCPKCDGQMFHSRLKGYRCSHCN